jgi:arylsulfatase A-like enzyme
VCGRDPNGLCPIRSPLANTIIVVTSDHGDYLGDHWLGEKDLFHDEVVRIPLIVVDPRPAADATRGTVSDALIEAIDLAPTFLEWAGGTPEPHRLEGRSLAALIAGEPDSWRDAVFCDSDFSLRHARRRLGLAPAEARAFMVRTTDWKYVHYERFPPQLFDLRNDPGELGDLGKSPSHQAVRDAMKDRLFSWLVNLRTRTTVSHDLIEKLTGGAKARGYRFGEW